MSSNNKFAHTDKLGRSIYVGSYIAAPFGNNSLSICKVLALTPKMVQLTVLPRCSKKYYKYPECTVLIDDDHVILWSLKNNA